MRTSSFLDNEGPVPTFHVVEGCSCVMLGLRASITQAVYSRCRKTAAGPCVGVDRHHFAHWDGGRRMGSYVGYRSRKDDIYDYTNLLLERTIKTPRQHYLPSGPAQRRSSATNLGPQPKGTGTGPGIPPDTIAVPQPYTRHLQRKKNTMRATCARKLRHGNPRHLPKRR
jgi:hypothetical protein